jgi:hypothetical protein
MWIFETPVQPLAVVDILIILKLRDSIAFGISIIAKRQKCGTAEIGRPERSERGTLPAVATTALFAVFISSMGRIA